MRKLATKSTLSKIHSYIFVSENSESAGLSVDYLYRTPQTTNLKRVMVRDGICGESAHGLKMMVAVSNSFYVTFCPILTSVANFIEIG